MVRQLPGTAVHLRQGKGGDAHAALARKRYDSVAYNSGRKVLMRSRIPLPWAQRPRGREAGVPAEGPTSRSPARQHWPHRKRVLTMAEVPHPWRAYARLQQQARRSRRTDARSWAFEAGLDYLLADSSRADEADEGVARTVSTARRREAHREGTLRRVAAEWNAPQHPETALHMRLTLEAIRSRLAGPDWDILCEVGVGRSYGEIADARGGSPGEYRIRVFRLRQRLGTPEAA